MAAVTCPECGGAGTIEVCWNNNPDRCQTVRCPECGGQGGCDVRDAEDEAYERAAARARANDFEETNGRDWT